MEESPGCDCLGDTQLPAVCHTKPRSDCLNTDRRQVQWPSRTHFPLSSRSFPRCQFQTRKPSVSHIASIISADLTHAVALLHSQCVLHIILFDCVSIIQDTEDTNPRHTSSATQIETCFTRLKAWWQSQTPSLDPDKFPSQVNLLCA